MKLEDLREKRKALGLTQFELAEKIFIDRSTISLIERGMRTPSVDVLKRMARVFGESIEIS